MTQAQYQNDMSTYDVNRIRADFPILSQEVHGKPLTFLDNGASAQKPRQVIDAMSNVYETEYANVHRGAYHLSERATERYEGARDIVQRFLNAKSRQEIVFRKKCDRGDQFGRLQLCALRPGARGRELSSLIWSIISISCPGN